MRYWDKELNGILFIRENDGKRADPNVAIVCENLRSHHGMSCTTSFASVDN